MIHAKFKTKTDMLDNLLEIEIAYNLLKTGDAKDMSDNPIDLHYKRLRCDMQVVERESDEFHMLSVYLKNTHAATHSNYKLHIEEIIRLERGDETTKFKSSIHNRHLLWHGSRLTNYAGILSQGLRIAPPEAPSTGYMFGKGTPKTSIIYPKNSDNGVYFDERCLLC